MSENSKLFDKIRISPRRAGKEKEDVQLCDWEGCEKPGTHRAPKPKSEGGGFHQFCLAHVRHYNQTFNFFAEEKSGDKIDDMLRNSARTGERPTWSTSANAHGRGGPRPRNGKVRDFSGKQFNDPLNLFARLARNQGRTPAQERERRLSEPDRRALETLGLTGRPETEEIKSAYKTLVKIHHPDANGGDKASEDRLRAIISAYTHLKQKGFV